MHKSKQRETNFLHAKKKIYRIPMANSIRQTTPSLQNLTHFAMPA